MLTLILISIIGILLLIIIIVNKHNTKKIEQFTNINNTIPNFANLTNNSNTPWTINNSLKTEILNIIHSILNNINKQINMSYYFTAFDQLQHDTISNTETRFTADIFVHEMKNLFTRKMLLVFCVNFKTKRVQIEYINLSNAFKMPDKIFMDYPTPALILQDDNLLSNKYHIMGLNKSTLDFSILQNNSLKEIPTPTEFQKWILPLGISSCQNPQSILPKHSKTLSHWDTQGINNITHTTNTFYPYINPTTNRINTYNSTHDSLFDIVNNNSGVSRLTAQ